MSSKQFLLSGKAYTQTLIDSKHLSRPKKPQKSVSHPTGRLMPLPNTPSFYEDHIGPFTPSSSLNAVRGRHYRISSNDRNCIMLPPIQHALKSLPAKSVQDVIGSKRNATTLPSISTSVLGNSEIDQVSYSYSSKLSVRLPTDTSVQYSSRFVGTVPRPKHQSVNVQRNQHDSSHSNRVRDILYFCMLKHNFYLNHDPRPPDLA